jgi:hypothetical protein
MISFKKAYRNKWKILKLLNKHGVEMLIRTMLLPFLFLLLGFSELGVLCEKLSDYLVECLDDFFNEKNNE